MSSRGRAIVSSVTLAALIGLSGACGGSSKSYTATKNAAQAKVTAAAQRKIAAERRRLALAQERARAIAARRAAIAARLHALAAQRAAQRAASSTTTTTPTTTPTTGPPPSTTTPTTIGPAPAANVASDLAAIQATLGRLNAAFRSGVAAGIATSETVNYRVVTGAYSAGQCAAFEAARGGGVVRESLAVHPGSFRADPGWIDPVAGLKPVGRVYAFVVDDVQTLVPTGEQRNVSFSTHATVRTDGQALLFLRCA